MEEKTKKIVTEGIKSFSQILIIPLLIVITIVLISVSGIYVIQKDDFKKVSDKNSSYSTTVNQEGKIVYTNVSVQQSEETNTNQGSSSDKENTDVSTDTDDTNIEDKIVEELADILNEYISGTEEEVKESIKYLMNAETVTKVPYIKSSGDDELQGQIKFYRYGENDEEYTTDSDGNKILNTAHMLTYIKPSDFKNKIQNYKNNGNEEVFKYYTLDEKSNVVIAYGSKEEKTITTNDVDIKEEIIEKYSGEHYNKVKNNTFKKTEYTIFEKTINYLSLIDGYIMPSNLLYALLIQTRDIDLVKSIASLAYENEIAIGIYDNETKIDITEKYNYKKIMELEGETILDLSSINTTNPVIKSTDMYSSQYSEIIHKCFFNTVNGKINHQQEKNDSTKTNTSKVNDMYVKDTNSSGQVKSLGTLADAKIFEVSFIKEQTTTSTPTVAVTVADTWIAKWQSSYSKEVEEKLEKPSDTLKDASILEFTQKTEVVNAFDTGMNVNKMLNEHMAKLKEQAINNIIDKTDFTVPVEPKTITVTEVNEATKKDSLDEHIHSCEECSKQVDNWWREKNNGGQSLDRFPPLNIYNPSIGTPILNMVTIDDIYEGLSITWRGLQGTIVETHYLECLDNYVKEQNEQYKKEAEEESKKGEEEKKKNFQKELNGQITSGQTIKGTKNFVEITYSGEEKRKTSKYKKDELIETTEIGEKFSEVLNNKDFTEANKAIKAREPWFWEYIRENEDTEKLETTLRILLNIATESKDFGEYSEEEIDDIFKAFEPEQLQTVLSNAYSPFGCNITREEFVQAVKSYDGGNTYKKTLATVAEDFYDVCTLEQYNVNPCLAFSWACMETGYGKSIPYNNIFGMAVYNRREFRNAI